MSLRLKLLVIVLLVGLVPLGISAWTTLALHQRALEERTAELHRKAAEYGATTVQAHLARTQASLSQAVRAIAWDALEEIAVVSLLDEQGRGLGPSAYLMAGAADEPELAGHPRPSLQTLSAFSTLIPFAEADGGSFAVGQAFASRELKAPLLPLAVPVWGAGGGRWVVAAAVSLESLCDAVVGVSARGAVSSLLDSRQRVLCQPGAATLLPAADAALLQAIPARPTTAVEQRVIEQHKRRIQIQSEVGHGTTLTIMLPAAPSGTHLAQETACSRREPGSSSWMTSPRSA